MRKHFSFILLIALMLSVFSIGYAATVQVGDGTGTTYQFPIYANYGYNYTQQIYTQEQIGTAGDITKIRFYYSSGNIASSKDWVIYMGHTQKASFTSNSDWVPFADLTVVFDGDVTDLVPSSAGWMEITLVNPFSYNNTDNLVIAVDENTPGYSSMYWGSFSSGSNTGIAYRNDSALNNPDPQDPPPASTRTSTINRIQLVFPDTVAPDAPQLLSPENGGQTFAGQSLRWTLPAGSADAAGYDVYIDGIMVSNNQPASTYPLPADVTMGTHEWYVIARNNIGDSPASETRNFEFVNGVIIGNGTYTQTFPFEAGYGFGRSLGLYTAEQIAQVGSITTLGWEVSTASPTAIPYKIYAKITTDTALTSMTWDAFTTGATLLKDGTDTPYSFDSTGWHTFSLDNPFAYTGGNLLIGVETNYGGSGNYSNHPKFRYSSGTAGSHQQWRTDSNPPTTNGTTNAQLPNLLMVLSPLSADPLFALNPEGWDFGRIIINTTGSQTFTISNAGGGNLSVTGISPESDGFFTVINSNIPADLGTGQTASFDIQYAPTAVGNHTATFTLPHSEGTTYIIVSGECYDPVIYDLPFFDGFETGQTHNTQVQEWTQILESGSNYWMANSTFTADNRTPRNGDFNATLRYNSNAWLTRPFSLQGGTSYDVEVWARQDASSGATLGLYYGTDGTVAELTNVIKAQTNITNGDYQQVKGSFTPENSGVYWIGLHGVLGYSPYYLSIDDITVRLSPTEPEFTYTPDTMEFGTTFVNNPTEYQNVRVTNTAAGTLVLETNDVSIVGPDAAMFEFELANRLELAANQYGDIPVRYNPTAEGTHTATLRMVYDATNYDVALSGSALGENALFESFEGETFPPEGWTVINGGDNNTWYRDTSTPCTGSAHARIDYTTSTAHDDWLITPQLAPTADNHTFSFYGRNGSGQWLEKFNVLVSTTTAETESFIVIDSDVDTGTTSYMLHTYDLSDYIGQQIYVAIQAISQDKFRLFIDDVSGPDRVPPPDVYAGEPYDAPNVDGAFFVSNQDLYKVPGFDGTTGPVADLNLDLQTSHVAAYTAASGSFDLIFSVTMPGTYYLMGYYNGIWNQGNPWPQVIVNEAGDVKDIVLEGINFGAKGDVYVVLTRGFDPTVPVELSQFAATITAENYVQIAWTTQSESNISGYNIYRNDSMDLSSAIKVSEMIEGTNTSEAHTYSYLDKELDQSGTYYYWLQNVELDGYTSFHGPVSVTFTAEDEGGGGAPPVNFVTRLENAYPNPFNPNTNIRYQLEKAGNVKIDIYNARGQLVRSFSRTHDAAGIYQINWDGRDSSGKAVSSGVYQYKMTSGKYHSTKKMVLKK